MTLQDFYEVGGFLIFILSGLAWYGVSKLMSYMDRKSGMSSDPRRITNGKS